MKPRARTTLHLLGLTVGVESRDAEDLRWLEEFLVPSLDVTDAPTYHVLVSYQSHTGHHAELLRTGTSGSAVPCFVLDRQTVAHPLVASLPAEQIVYDPELDLFYRVRPGARQVLIHAAEGNPVARIGLMRVVRELAMGYLWRLEGAVAHAAALELEGRAMVIAGPKGSGKTTLLTWLLQEQGTRYLGNDRVFLRSENGRALARGLPTLVSLRAETLATFPQLRGRLALRPSRSTERTGETPTRRSPPGGPQARSLSPQQFCDALAVGRSGESNCAILLFPQVRHDGRGVELVPLPPRAAADRLIDLLLRRGHAEGPGVFDFEWKVAARPADAEATCRTLAARVPSFACLLGPQAYRSSPGASALLQELRR
jgi:hypothetical protein